ncbi:MAG: xseB [Verrucomicrobia bacterium]|jgi:exodeoxyribonuclease VII small subunit|nr:xseB [Verrucomicrobiota bacterium]
MGGRVLGFALMSKVAKGATRPETEEVPFEVALQKLEAIVEAMESEELPLETLLTRYEEGTKLAAQCQARLADADLKISKLEKKSSGDFTLTPVELPGDTAED